MKNQILILVFALFVSAIEAQQSNANINAEKGIAPIKVVSDLSTVVSNTYAVVVGISDYQDPGIPDLRFADKDAEAFANFLRSKAGGSVHGDNLQLLTNAQATAGRIAEALDAIIEKAKKDDLVIIYFSGHGDVEGKKLTQPGFLLCWDAPSRVYMGGGTYSLSFLQEVVSTLSIQNQAKVVVITDACHAGKLAGSQIGGAQLTTSNLAKQYANEVKILSCQPNEFSLEGPQWGGGRGVFSYHLVDGLYGLADRNNDGQVTLGEIDRYLEDHVTAEAAPQSQVPILLGNKMDRLATVNSNVLADLRKNKSLDMAVFASIESRGFEEEILSKADTTIQVMYKAFKQAVAQKRFLYPESDCAEKYYIQLEQVAELAPLRGIMKRNYAAALQDDAQQTINKYMKAEVHEVSLSPKTKITRYDDFPRQLARAAELLGETHYLYRTLQARKAYFEGFPLIFGGEFTQDMLQKAGSKFQEALSWDPDMPLALLGMEWFHGFGLAVADSAEYYARRATVNSPTWILPYVKLSVVYSEMLSDFVKSKEYLDLAAKIDSTSPLYWEAEGAYYFFQNRFKEAEVVLIKILSTGSTSNCLPCSQKLLVKLYLETGRLEEALILSKQSVLSDSSNYTSHISLGTVLTKMGRYKEAEEEFKIASFLSAQKTNPEVNLTYWRAFIYSHQNKMDEAFEAFEQSIKLGYDDYAWMLVDPDMELLRAQTERWNALMKKYFPDKVKN